MRKTVTLNKVLREYYRSGNKDAFFEANSYFFGGRKVVAIEEKKHKIIFENNDYQYYSEDDCQRIYLVCGERVQGDTHRPPQKG